VFSFLNDISLPVVTGGPICFGFFSRMAGVTWPVSVYLALGIAIYIIYTLDHLKDITRQVRKPESGKRLHFLSGSRGLHIALSGAGAIYLLYMLFSGGLSDLVPLLIAPGALTALYFLLITFARRFRFTGYFRETLIALIVTWTVAGVPMQYAGHYFYGQLIFFYLVCMLNLMLFSWYDHASDIETGTASLAVSLGMKNLNRAGWTVSVLLTALWLVFMVTDSFPGTGFPVSGLMGLTLIVLWSRKQSRYDPALSRFLGDLVFVYPLFFY
jgi:hypothetical protein